MTWTDLLTIEPGLAHFEQEAREAGKNGADWWPQWVASFREFKHIVQPLGTAAREVVLDHLRVEFQRAQRRARHPKDRAAVIQGLTNEAAANEGAKHG